MSPLRSKSYVIRGKPIAWRRAAPSWNHHHLYDPQTHDKLIMRIDLEKQHDNEPLFNSAVHLDMFFYFLQPKSIKYKKPNPYHCQSPDVDNCIKLILDSIKNVLITDDRIVSSLAAHKLWDDVARTEFTITSLI